MTDHHHHDHGHDSQNVGWTERNRAHWDKAASTYNSTLTQSKFGNLINKVTSFILQNTNWMGVPFLEPSSTFESKPTSTNRSVRVLDYACGPGTITAALAGYATEYVGIDISEKMVEEYNKRFTNPALPTVDNNVTPIEDLNAHAIVGDLFEPDGASSHLKDDKYFNFDLAAVSGGFHHFEHLELATQRLVERLKPGGVLLIFDFLTHAPDDMKGNPATETVVHHGFGEARVRQLFGDAGLEDVDIRIMPEKVTLSHSAERTGFLARGRKPMA